MATDPLESLKSKLQSAGLEGDGLGPRRTRAARDPIDAAQETFMGASIPNISTSGEAGGGGGDDGAGRRRRARVPRHDPAADDLPTDVAHQTMAADSALEAELAKLRLEHAEMLQSNAQKVEQLESMMGLLRKENEKAKEDLSVYQDLTVELTNEENPNAYILAEHIKGMIKSVEERDSLAKQKADLESELAEATKKMEQTQLDQSALTQGSDGLLTELEEAKASLAAIQEQNEQLLSEKQQLSTDNQQLSTENQQLNDKLQEQLDQIALLSTANPLDQMEAGSAPIIPDDRVTELEDRIAQLEDELSQAQAQMSQIQGELDARQTTIAELENRLAASQTTESTTEAMAGMSLDAEDEAIIAQAEADLKRMEELIKETENYIAELEGQQEKQDAAAITAPISPTEPAAMS